MFTITNLYKEINKNIQIEVLKTYKEPFNMKKKSDEMEILNHLIYFFMIY